MRYLHFQNVRNWVDTNNWPQARQLKWPSKSFHNEQLARPLYLSVLWTLLLPPALQTWSFRTWHLNTGPGRHCLISSWGKSNLSSPGRYVSTPAALVSALFKLECLKGQSTNKHCGNYREIYLVFLKGHIILFVIKDKLTYSETLNIWNRRKKIPLVFSVSTFLLQKYSRKCVNNAYI